PPSEGSPRSSCSESPPSSPSAPSLASSPPSRSRSSPSASPPGGSAARNAPRHDRGQARPARRRHHPRDPRLPVGARVRRPRPQPGARLALQRPRPPRHAHRPRLGPDRDAHAARTTPLLTTGAEIPNWAIGPTIPPTPHQGATRHMNPYSPPTYQAPPAPKKPRRWPWILGIVAAFVLGNLSGQAAPGAAESATPSSAPGYATAETDGATGPLALGTAVDVNGLIVNVTEIVTRAEYTTRLTCASVSYENRSDRVQTRHPW